MYVFTCTLPTLALPLPSSRALPSSRDMESRALKAFPILMVAHKAKPTCSKVSKACMRRLLCWWWGEAAVRILHRCNAEGSKSVPEERDVSAHGAWGGGAMEWEAQRPQQSSQAAIVHVSWCKPKAQNSLPETRLLLCPPSRCGISHSPRCPASVKAKPFAYYLCRGPAMSSIPIILSV